jgi:hypothetical protein
VHCFCVFCVDDIFLFSTTKKSIKMSNLKEKFGKFELGKEQVKSVKGGQLVCVTTTGDRIVFQSPTNAASWCNRNISTCIGCF